MCCLVIGSRAAADTDRGRVAIYILRADAGRADCNRNAALATCSDPKALKRARPKFRDCTNRASQSTAAIERQSAPGAAQLWVRVAPLLKQ